MAVFKNKIIGRLAFVTLLGFAGLIGWSLWTVTSKSVSEAHPARFLDEPIVRASTIGLSQNKVDQPPAALLPELPEPSNPFHRMPPQARLMESRIVDASEDEIIRRISLWAVNEGLYPVLRSVEYWHTPQGFGSEAPELLATNYMLADYLVLSVPPTAVEAVEAELTAFGFEIVRRYPFSPVWQVRLPDSDIDAVPRGMDRLHENLKRAAAVSISPDYLSFPSAVVPNDSRYADQWQWPVLGAPDAWEATTGANDVIVAVIDSGLFTDASAFTVHNDFTYSGGHNIWINPGEDLDGDKVLNDPDDLNGVDDDNNGLVDDLSGWDFYEDDPIAEDLAGHGTGVAGLIGAAGNNGYGITGASWRVALLPLKAGDFIYPWSALAHSLDYARSLREAGFPLLITNHSYGDSLFTPEPLYEQALERARDAGLLVVASAGNGGLDLDNSFGSFLPAEATLENILSVASTDDLDRLSGFSNFGAVSVDLAAPGEDLLTLTRINGFSPNSGTSFATALVSGAAALLLAENPSLDFAQIKELLMRDGKALNTLEGKTVSGRRLALDTAVNRTVATAEPYAYWQWQHWGDNFAENPDALPSADPDGDGSSNQLEYYLQSNPLGSGGSALQILQPISLSQLETVAGITLEVPSGDYAHLRLSRNTRAPAAAMSFFSTAALEDNAGWTIEIPTVLQAESIPGSPGTEKVDAYFLLPDQWEKKFIRVGFPDIDSPIDP